MFGQEYELRTLEETEQYIAENNHLPEIPSAQEIEENGADLGELVRLQMMKIEELTLHLIEVKKELKQLQSK